MRQRSFWKDVVEAAWARKSVVWLRGVRRVGKTTLARSLDRVRYFDCELPGVRRRVEDVESFLRTTAERVSSSTRSTGSPTLPRC